MTRIATLVFAIIFLIGPILALADDHKAKPNYTIRMTTVLLTDVSYQGGSNFRSLQVGYRIGSEQSKLRQVVNVGAVQYAVIGKMDKDSVKKFQQMLKDLYKNWGRLKASDRTSTSTSTSKSSNNRMNTTTAMYMEIDVAGSKGDTFSFTFRDSTGGVKKEKEIKIGRVQYQVDAKMKKKTVKLIDKYLDILCKNWEGLKGAPVRRSEGSK